MLQLQGGKDNGKLKVDIEFIGPFREKAGVQYTSLDIPVVDSEMNAVGILREVEGCFKREKLKLLKGNRVMPGVLLFIRRPTGGIERIKPEDSIYSADKLELVVAPMMDGG